MLASRARSTLNGRREQVQRFVEGRQRQYNRSQGVFGVVRVVPWMAKEILQMKASCVIALTLIAVAGVAMTGAAAARDPISILGNGDFTEGNGVLSGTGTAGDPYVIAGWEIAVPIGGFYGVKIENVTASFVLRGLVISGAGEPDGAAIRIGFAAGGVIEDCSVASSLNGIEIASSTDVIVRNTVLYVLGTGLSVTGESPDEYRHRIEDTNLLNGSPIRYYYGLDGERIEGIEAKHITVAASRDVTVTGNSILDGDGIHLAYVTDSAVTANLVGRNSNVLTGHAVQLYRSDRNRVTTNLIKNSRRSGIQLTLSAENEITGNYLGVNDTGIRLIGSSDNLLAENELVGCFTAIWLVGASQGNGIDGNIIVGKVREGGDRRQGIVLDLTSENRIERNGLTECEMGITLAEGASHNRVASNSIVAGGYGIFISGSYNEIEGNLVTQHSRGILFPETYGRSVARGNTFTGNVLADNGGDLRTNLDCESNAFTGNVFLGAKRGDLATVLDYGTGNRWTVDGVGNFWGGEPIEDADGDGIGDTPVVLGAIVDDAPLASIDATGLSLGILGTLSARVVRIERGDGSMAEVEALVAEKGFERWVGFRGFPASLLEGFPGILFVFHKEAELRFTMVTVPFDLDITFFGATGQVVGSTTMTAFSQDLYTATAPFQYALELASGTLSQLSIDENSRLLLPVEE
jgi:parallel beta-helix repeat protein